MYYGSTEEFTDWSSSDLNNWKIRFTYLLLFFIPRANPDNEKLYPLVRKWLLETDENDIPIREVALDQDGKVLFSSPNIRNYGLWTDNGAAISKDRLNPIEKSVFESLWSESEMKQNLSAQDTT